MAKRRKRKHRTSDIYQRLVKKLETKSIIPTITPKAKTSRIESKQIRDSIRKAYAEQRKQTIITPKYTYTSNRKKNRKQARQKRKEKKQKAKQLQQQRQLQQEEPTIEVPTIDYGERDEDFRSETPEIDDTTNYIEDLIKKVDHVNETLLATYGKWVEYLSFSKRLDELRYWLEEALQLPYEDKVTIADTLEGNQFLSALDDVLHLAHYKEVEESVDSIASEIIAIIESVY